MPEASTKELTALELNNQIVHMRKTVDQAKFHVSRKLIRRARALQQKKGKEEEIKKNKRKAERFLAEVKAVKRLKRDGVTKLALVNTKTFADFAIEKETPPLQRATAKLITSKPILNSVSKFRKTYPTWHQTVPFLLQRLGLQYQKKTPTEPVPVITPMPPKDGRRKYSSSDKSESISSENSSPQLQRSKKMKTLRSPREKGKIVPDKESKSDVRKKSRSISKEAVVEPINMDELSSTNKLSILAGNRGQEENYEEKSFTKPSSSFFVGGVDEDEGGNSDENSENAVENQKSNPKRPKSLDPSEMMMQPKAKVSKNRKETPKTQPREKRIEKNITSEPPKGGKSATGLSGIHASWEAKKQQKMKERVVIGAPAAKKIVFDSDDD